MKKQIIAKQLLKIAKELLAVRINIVFDFTLEKKVFAEFKKQQPWLTCEFYQSGAQSYWKISDNKKTSIIDFDYFEKTDSYHGVFMLDEKEYYSLKDALDNLKFGIDFDDNNWFEKLDNSNKNKIINYFIEKYDEKFIFNFSSKPYKAKDLIGGWIIDMIYAIGYEEFAEEAYRVGNIKFDEKDKEAIKEIEQKKNIYKNALYLLKKHGSSHKPIKLNGFLIWNNSMFDISQWWEWQDYDKKDWMQDGYFYDVIVANFQDYINKISLTKEMKKEINKIIGN